MTSWDELDRALRAVDPQCPSRGSVTDLRQALEDLGESSIPAGQVPKAIVDALAEVDRVWIAELGQDPDTSKEQIEAAAQRCEELRAAHGHSVMPPRYARVEALGTLGQRDDAIEQLRVARLFSFDGADTGAILAAARLHDDYSGVIRTTTAVASRPEADPVGTARSLGATLIPYLAQGRRVEAEDALASLAQLDLPHSARLRALGDQLEFLGLSSQWQRALAMLRHTDLTGAAKASGWTLMNAGVGLALVLREAVRADYGRNAVGLSLDWATPWGDLKITGWDTVARAYDLTTAFVRAIAVRLDKRNGNNTVSLRVETRMAAESSSLSARSYGTVTSAAPTDPARLRNRPALLREVRELLTLGRGYGMESVHDRAIPLAETVSASLAEVTDDSALELVVDLRLAFGRLLAALGANERAEKENLDTAELSLSQGWTEMACAALALAAHAAHARGNLAGSRVSWERCRAELANWPSGRPGERCTVLADAIGDPGLSARVMEALAANLVEGVEEDHSRASVVREILNRASAQLARCAHPPQGVVERLAEIETRVAPYGRGRGGRRRGSGAGVG
ncbi:hypothetical protein ACSL103130_02100 [Actinomyces slackii]|uniref:ATP-dependent transcriptional regulator n=1 Tax=Actinomyces slackii TaxID=52774 RepID=A0A448KDY6_9ACTO|nr:hypothetical protein [Actinomyces slackii]VEG75131.1 Uncharacterised protein [Actinomyces slackii]